MPSFGERLRGPCEAWIRWFERGWRQRRSWTWVIAVGLPARGPDALLARLAVVGDVG